MEFSHTEKLTLSITEKEFNKYAISLVPKEQLHKNIKSELMQCACGIVNGEKGGSYIDDWQQIFYYHLFLDGIIEQTELSKKRFGVFDKH